MIVGILTIPTTWDVDVIVPLEMWEQSAFVQAVVTVWMNNTVVYQTVTPYFMSALRYLN
jgi:putative intracellular protease/amidase